MEVENVHMLFVFSYLDGGLVHLKGREAGLDVSNTVPKRNIFQKIFGLFLFHYYNTNLFWISTTILKKNLQIRPISDTFALLSDPLAQ